ncbi:MAG: cellulose biosynthesis protein BcsS [Hyphomicrobiaceae bacterium]|nr:MAG: cellulose biosynthesis protein BcsS [Hyphomicrobiaceae bacterium]
MELWVGAEAFVHAWSLYSGATLAPFGGIQQNGVRLRAVAGYGGFNYASPRWNGTAVETVKFQGAVSFADVLAGYHHQLGPVTLKIFAGLQGGEHSISPDDPQSQVKGAGLGVKGVLEGWWNIGDKAWSSADLAWGSLHQNYAARLRLGWRALPMLSAGLEAGASGNEECDLARGGGFVRYEWARGEVALSAGLSGDRVGVATVRSTGPFATVSWLTRF